MTPVEVIGWGIATGVATGVAAFAIVAIAGALRMVREMWRIPHRTCGVINAGLNLPCVLPNGHVQREHATPWLRDDAEPRKELRHRWDDNDPFGRDERRYKPEHLPKFTKDGERAEA